MRLLLAAILVLALQPTSVGSEGPERNVDYKNPAHVWENRFQC